MSQSVISISQVGYWSGKQLNLESENADKAIYRVMFIGGNTDHQDNRIQYRKVTSSGGSQLATAWYDSGGGPPAYLSSDNVTFGSGTGTNAQYVYLKNGSDVGVFTNPFYVASGPTVTSITVANEIASTRQFTVTHTGTLSASDISYTINGTDITTFGSPSTPITNLQSTSTGSTFDSYTLSTQGSHSVNIGDKFLNFYVLSATTTENDIVSNNNISVTFPNVDVNATGPWTNQLGTLVSGTTTSIKSFSTNRVRIKLLNNLKITSIMIYKSFNSSTGYSIVIEHWDYGNLTGGFPAYTTQVQYVDPDTLYENTGSPNKLLTLPSNMLVDTYNWNFATINVQVQSNGGGKPDRYPLIMTNLFNRNRSLYSIGMTHKDTWDLFL